MQTLFRYYHYNPDFQKGKKNEDEQVQHTIDFIAGMTDDYFLSHCQKHLIPQIKLTRF